MRHPRFKRDNRTSWYVVGNEAGGPIGGKAMACPEARRLFERLLRRDARRFRCSVAAYSVLANGFQIAVRFPRFRKLSRAKLRRIAKRFYKRRKRPPYLNWDDKQWADFNRRLFDVSAFMGSLEGDYGQRWNLLYGCRGHFWRERFWSTLCEDISGARQCVLLTEAKPVQTGLSKRPEDWKEGSARLRRLRRDGWLTPLKEIFPDDQGDPWAIYRDALLGGILNQSSPVSDAAFERAHGERGSRSGQGSRAPRGGRFTLLERWLERGAVVGTAQQVQPWLDRLKSRRRYACRGKPAPIPGAAPLTVLRAPARQRPTSASPPTPGRSVP